MSEQLQLSLLNKSRFTRLSDWKKQLLTQRGLETPDGRALYLYRLTEDDFKDLEQLLRKILSLLLPRHGLASVANLSGFAELFVLYAAEWWRRRYDGAGFRWEPILRDLDANPEDWSPTQRSDYVKQGFRGWRIRPRESGSLRFIGSVAVQGGLPLKLLAKSRGRIGQLLSRVLHLASGSQVTLRDLQNWVESLANTLPKSYRQETIYTLLTDVAWTVLRLKQEANLKTSENVVEILDQKIPNWRDRFPLPVDDNDAQGMIEQLIRDVAVVRVERQQAVLPVDRLLEKNSDNEWELHSNLVLPEVISTQNIASLFSVEISDLPRSAELSLRVGAADLSISMRILAGQQKYRLQRKPLGFSDDAAIGEHLLRMASPDGRVWTITANRGDEIDPDLPWVFSERDSRMLLARQGSGSIATQQALVAIPKDWTIKQNEDLETNELGPLRSLNRRIFEVRGVFLAHNEDGLTFRLRTGRADAHEEAYIWHGDRCWLDFISPNVAFRGIPALYRLDEEGSKRKMDRQIGVRPTAGLQSSSPVSGPVYLHYPESGDIQHRSRVLVLPEAANIEFNPSSAISGIIQFSNWDVVRVEVTTKNIEQKLVMSGGNARLQLTVEKNQSIPDIIELQAYWPNSRIPARFRLPFPAHGVRVLDGEGRSLSNNSVLAVQRLQGVRILISGGRANCRAEMWLCAPVGRYTKKHSLCTLPGSLSMEIRLQDYLPDIQHLFSMSDSPDAQVEIQVRPQGASEFMLRLARYAETLEHDEDSIYLGIESLRTQQHEDLKSLSVLALRLESPGDEAQNLEPCTSEGVATGVWTFPARLRSPGAWLVYPAVDSPIPFRPTLWTIRGEVKRESGLSSALSIVDQQDREQAIDEIIDTLASDFHNNDWEKVGQLAGQIGHLPLSTLDIWRRFANSSRGMAALVLRFSDLKLEFISRFSQELSFAWEAITFEDWLWAMRQADEQCIDLFGEQNSSIVHKPHLSDRIQSLTSLNGTLTFMLQIAASKWFPDTQREVALLKVLGENAPHALFDGENSKLMALRRLHADDDWPGDLIPVYLSSGQDFLTKTYLHASDEDFRNSVINIPIILAVQTITGQSVEWLQDAERIHALRRYQAFDPEWFEEAYNQTIARCFADGLLDEIQKS